MKQPRTRLKKSKKVGTIPESLLARQARATENKPARLMTQCGRSVTWSDQAELAAVWRPASQGVGKVPNWALVTFFATVSDRTERVGPVNIDVKRLH